MRYGLALLLMCVVVPQGLAHPVPAAQVQVELDDGSYAITVQADVAALVMAEPPGHLGADKAEELGALTEKQLRDRIDDVRRGFVERLKIVFDGELSTPAEITFTEPSEVRQNARVQHTEDATCRIRVRGQLPANPHTLSITFTEDIGPVQLIIRRGNETLQTRRLDAGQASGPLELKETPTAPRERQPASIVPVAIACSVVGVLFFLGAFFWGRKRTCQGTATK